MYEKSPFNDILNDSKMYNETVYSSNNDSSFRSEFKESDMSLLKLQNSINNH